MAVAFDAHSKSSGTGSLSWTHTPSGTPKGVVVFIVQTDTDLDLASPDQVTGVTYGGTSMTEVTGSPLAHTAGEYGAVYAYHLGASIPTGAQTVAVTCNPSSAGQAKVAFCYTLTAAADTAIQATNTSINSTTYAGATSSLALGGASCFVCEACHSGQNAVDSITPYSGWTSQDEHDFGFQTAGSYSYNTVGTSDVNVGWTQTSDDGTCIAVAVKEVSTNHPAPDTLKVDYQTTPSNTTEAPTFTATAHTTGGGAQTFSAADIEVATDSAFTNKVAYHNNITLASAVSNNGTVKIKWNVTNMSTGATGWTQHDALKSGTTYYWRLKLYETGPSTGPSDWATYSTFSGIVRKWAATDYVFRRKLTFNTTHPIIPIGYTANFQFQTGHRKIVANNGAFNESIQASGGFQIVTYGSRTHIVYLALANASTTQGANPDHEIWIVSYNRGTQTWGSPKFLFSTDGGVDTHYFPVVECDKYGYVHVVMSGHYDQMRYTRSRLPNETGSLSTDTTTDPWVKPSTGSASGGIYDALSPPTTSTYPVLTYIAKDNYMYLFYRKGGLSGTGQYCYMRSTETSGGSQDIGKTWSSEYTIIDDPGATSGDDPYSQQQYEYRIYAYGHRWDALRDRYHIAFTVNAQDAQVVDSEEGLWYIYSTLNETDGSSLNVGFNLWKNAAGALKGRTSTAGDDAHTTQMPVIAYDGWPTFRSWAITDSFYADNTHCWLPFILNLALDKNGKPIVFWEQKFTGDYSNTGTSYAYARETSVWCATWSADLGSSGSWVKASISDNLNYLLRVRRSSIAVMTDIDGIIRFWMPVAGKTFDIRIPDTTVSSTNATAITSTILDCLDDKYSEVIVTNNYVTITSSGNVVMWKDTTATSAQIPTDRTPISVVVEAVVQKAAAGGSTGTSVFLQKNGTKYSGDTVAYSDATYWQTIRYEWLLKPSDSTAWTNSDLNATGSTTRWEFGIQEASATIRVAAVRMKIKYRTAADSNMAACDILQFTSRDDGVTWSFAKEESRNSTIGIPIMTNKNSLSQDQIEVAWCSGSDLFYLSYLPHDKMSVTGEDIRIYYQGATDGSATEIDRIVNYPNMESSLIEFKVQAQVSASAAAGVGDYYLYYGNPTNTTKPLANPKNVYFFYEGWEDLGENANTNSAPSSAWKSDGYISAVTFSGAGLNDMTAQFNTSYTGTDYVDYIITVTSAGTDTFVWKKVGSSDSSPITITAGSWQSIGSEGLQVKFAAGTGHTTGNNWTVDIRSAGLGYWSPPQSPTHGLDGHAIRIGSGQSTLLINTPSTTKHTDTGTGSGTDFLSIEYAGWINDAYATSELYAIIEGTTASTAFGYKDGYAQISQDGGTTWTSAFATYGGLTFNQTSATMFFAKAVLHEQKLDFYYNGLPIVYAFKGTTEAGVSATNLRHLKFYSDGSQAFIDHIKIKKSLAKYVLQTVAYASVTDGDGSYQAGGGSASPTYNATYHCKHNFETSKVIKYRVRIGFYSDNEGTDGAGTVRIHPTKVNPYDGANYISGAVDVSKTTMTAYTWYYVWSDWIYSSGGPASFQVAGQSYTGTNPVFLSFKIDSIEVYSIDYSGNDFDPVVVIGNEEYKGIWCSAVLQGRGKTVFRASYTVTNETRRFVTGTPISLLQTTLTKSYVPIDNLLTCNAKHSLMVDAVGAPNYIFSIPASTDATLHNVIPLNVEYWAVTEYILRCTVEYGKSLIDTKNLQIENSAGKSISYFSPVEYQSNWIATQSLPVTYNSILSRVARIPTSYESTLSYDSTVNIEYTPSFSTNRFLTTEITKGANTVAGTAIETTGNRLISGRIPVESIMSASRSYLLSIENTFSILNKTVIPTEYGKQLFAIVNTPILSVLSYVQAPTVAIESQLGVVQALLAPVSTSAGFARSYLIPIEGRGSLTAGYAIPTEYKQTRQHGLQFPVEYGVQIVPIKVAIPITQNSGFGQVVNLPLNYDGLVSLAQSLVFSIEYRAGISTAQPIAIESLITAAYVLPFPIETTTRTSHSVNAWVEYQQILDQLSLLPVSNQIKRELANNLAIETGFGFARTSPLITENLGALLGRHSLPIEYVKSPTHVIGLPIGSSLVFSKVTALPVSHVLDFNRSTLIPITNGGNLVQAYNLNVEWTFGSLFTSTLRFPIEYGFGVSIIDMLPVTHGGSWNTVVPLSTETNTRIESRSVVNIEYTMSRVLRDYFDVEYGKAFRQATSVIAEYLGRQDFVTNVGIEWKANKQFGVTVTVESVKTQAVSLSFQLETLVGVLLRYNIPADYLGTIIAALIIRNVALKVPTIVDPSLSIAVLDNLLLRVAAIQQQSMKTASVDSLVLKVNDIVQQTLLGGFTEDAS